MVALGVDKESIYRMSELDKEIAAYESMRSELEAHYLCKWVIFHATKHEGTFDSFNSAAEQAVKRFGAGPYLIRQVGAPKVVIPTSVMYHPVS